MSNPNTTSNTNSQLQLMNPPPGESSPQVPAVLHDIHPPVELPEPPPYLLYGAIGALTLLVLGLLLFYLKKRRSRPVPPMPPWVLARNDVMEARTLMQKGAALEYMARVSDILRRYLEARFSLKPTRQTTREFLRSVSDAKSGSPLNPYSDVLRQCLECCDMAKYARRAAATSQLEQMERTVLDIIETTSAETEPKEAA